MSKKFLKHSQSKCDGFLTTNVFIALKSKVESLAQGMLHNRVEEMLDLFCENFDIFNNMPLNQLKDAQKPDQIILGLIKNANTLEDLNDLFKKLENSLSELKSLSNSMNLLGLGSQGFVGCMNYAIDKKLIGTAYISDSLDTNSYALSNLKIGSLLAKASIIAQTSQETNKSFVYKFIIDGLMSVQRNTDTMFKVLDILSDLAEDLAFFDIFQCLDDLLNFKTNSNIDNASFQLSYSPDAHKSNDFQRLLGLILPSLYDSTSQRLTATLDQASDMLQQKSTLNIALQEDFYRNILLKNVLTLRWLNETLIDYVSNGLQLDMFRMIPLQSLGEQAKALAKVVETKSSTSSSSQKRIIVSQSTADVSVEGQGDAVGAVMAGVSWKMLDQLGGFLKEQSKIYSDESIEYVKKQIQDVMTNARNVNISKFNILKENLGNVAGHPASVWLPRIINMILTKLLKAAEQSKLTHKYSAKDFYEIIKRLSNENLSKDPVALRFFKDLLTNNPLVAPVQPGLGITPEEIKLRARTQSDESILKMASDKARIVAKIFNEAYANFNQEAMLFHNQLNNGASIGTNVDTLSGDFDGIAKTLNNQFLHLTISIAQYLISLKPGIAAYNRIYDRYSKRYSASKPTFADQSSLSKNTNIITKNIAETDDMLNKLKIAFGKSASVESSVKLYRLNIEKKRLKLNSDILMTTNDKFQALPIILDEINILEEMIQEIEYNLIPKISNESKNSNLIKLRKIFSGIYKLFGKINHIISGPDLNNLETSLNQSLASSKKMYENLMLEYELEAQKLRYQLYKR